MVVSQRFADTLMQCGQSEKAIQFYRQACELSQDMYQTNPTADTLRGHAVSLNYLGNALDTSGHPDEAYKVLQKAHTAFNKQFHEYPSGLTAQDLATSHYQLMKYAESEALKNEHLQKCVSIFQWAMDRGLTMDPQIMAVLTALSALVDKKQSAGPAPSHSTPGAQAIQEPEWLKEFQEKDREKIQHIRYMLPVYEAVHRDQPSIRNARQLANSYSILLDMFVRKGQYDRSDEYVDGLLEVMDWMEAQGA